MPLRSLGAEAMSRAEQVSRIGDAAAALVRNVPNPARIKDLAERPETAPLAAAKEVAARLGPVGASATKVVDGISKQIDRASGVDYDR
jgi:hypothetical protein